MYEIFSFIIEVHFGSSIGAKNLRGKNARKDTKRGASGSKSPGEQVENNTRINLKQAAADLFVSEFFRVRRRSPCQSIDSFFPCA